MNLTINLLEFPPQVLLGEIQHDADELFQLVLSYPEFAEPLKLIRHFEAQQNAWMEEKKALLILVKSWENLVLKINGDDKEYEDKNKKNRSNVSVLGLQSLKTCYYLLLLNIRADEPFLKVGEGFRCIPDLGRIIIADNLDLDYVLYQFHDDDYLLLFSSLYFCIFLSL